MSFQNANLLIQQFVSNYGNTGRTYEVFDYVRGVSQQNNKVILDPNTFLRAPGKKRQVRLTYFPILCDVDGDCSTQNLCSTGTKVEPKQIMFDITRCTATPVYTIAKEDIRLLDNNQWDFTETARQIIASALPGARRTMATEWTTRLYQLAGVHPDGNPVKRISVTNPASGIVNPIGRFDIEREYNDAGFMSPWIYGGQEVYNWKAMVGIGGLNAQGQRIDQLSTANSYYDSGLSDTILNDLANGGHILTIAPEVFKYVYYLENAGIFRTDMTSIDDLGMLYRTGYGGAFIEGTLVDPVTGLPWDLYIRYNECAEGGGEWNFFMKHTWDFFVMPDVACNGQGVNGIMHWRTCPQVVAACPTGDTPSPAVNPTTYSWTPGDILPYTIFTSTIGGVYNEQSNGVEDGTTVTTLNQLAAFMNDNYTGGDTLFTVSGSNIVYSGFDAITGDFNGGSAAGGISFTFS